MNSRENWKTTLSGKLLDNEKITENNGKLKRKQKSSECVVHVTTLRFELSFDSEYHLLFAAIFSVPASTKQFKIGNKHQVEVRKARDNWKFQS